jgi:hypothetical protein
MDKSTSLRWEQESSRPSSEREVRVQAGFLHPRACRRTHECWCGDAAPGRSCSLERLGKRCPLRQESLGWPERHSFPAVVTCVAAFLSRAFQGSAVPLA